MHAPLLAVNYKWVVQVSYNFLCTKLCTKPARNKVIQWKWWNKNYGFCLEIRVFHVVNFHWGCRGRWFESSQPDCQKLRGTRFSSGLFFFSSSACPAFRPDAGWTKANWRRSNALHGRACCVCCEMNFQSHWYSASSGGAYWEHPELKTRGTGQVR